MRTTLWLRLGCVAMPCVAALCRANLGNPLKYSLFRTLDAAVNLRVECSIPSRLTINLSPVRSDFRPTDWPTADN
jgi:hypothetical protein